MDRRDIEAAALKGDKRSIFATDIESYRLKKYIGAYSAALGKVDAIVFTAGAGEMNWKLRERVLSNLETFGIKLNKFKNQEAQSREKESIISADDSKVKILVIPTDEEIVFIEDVVAILEGKYDTHTHFKYYFEDPKYKKKAG